MVVIFGLSLFLPKQNVCVLMYTKFNVRTLNYLYTQTSLKVSRTSADFHALLLPSPSNVTRGHWPSTLLLSESSYCKKVWTATRGGYLLNTIKHPGDFVFPRCSSPRGYLGMWLSYVLHLFLNNELHKTVCKTMNNTQSFETFVSGSSCFLWIGKYFPQNQDCIGTVSSSWLLNRKLLCT
jgi:hypothetical protein